MTVLAYLCGFPKSWLRKSGAPWDVCLVFLSLLCLASPALGPAAQSVVGELGSCSRLRPGSCQRKFTLSSDAVRFHIRKIKQLWRPISLEINPNFLPFPQASGGLEWVCKLGWSLQHPGRAQVHCKDSVGLCKPRWPLFLREVLWGHRAAWEAGPLCL